MAEYDLDFSKELIESAQIILNKKEKSFNTYRTIIYFSLLSCEITLKALLEQAKISIKEIKSCSHDFEKLFYYFGSCEIPTFYSESTWKSASNILAQTVLKGTMGTVGLILSNTQDVSKYPNNIRYGDVIKHYSPDIILKTAIVTLEWAEKYWDTIKINKERYEKLKALKKSKI